MSSEEKLDSGLRILDSALNVSATSGVRWNKSKTRFSTGIQFGETTTHYVQREKNRKIRKSDLRDLSLTIYPDEEISLLDDSVTVTESVPFSLLRVLDSLFSQFQSIYQTSGNTQLIFEAVSSFVELLTNTVSSIWSGKDLTDKLGNNIQWLLDELNTWRLLLALYKDRTTVRNDAEPMETSRLVHHPTSEKEIVSDLYYNDRTVREAQLVVDWLETCCKHESKLLAQPSIVHFTDKTVAWENTLCQLNGGTVNFGSDRGSVDLVTTIDPDCIYREEGRRLHYLDSTNDSRLIKQIFREIRCGQLEHAQQLCVHCGQVWRAAVLEGWRLFHDPNYDNVYHAMGGGETKRAGNEREILPVEGNPNRDIWKMCAWNMCEDPHASADERAVMGALCGHLPSLLPLCTTWEDQLWAYTRVSVDIAVEQQIRQVSLKNYQPLDDSYWSNLRTMEKIVKEIARKDDQFKPNRTLQELLILDKCEELISVCTSWLEDQKEALEPQFLRYLCHLVLVLRAVGRPGPAYLSDQVIIAYVKVLMKKGDCDSVAYYSSLLPEVEQVDLYSKFMEEITDKNDRAECLEAAEKYNLNIPLITEKVVHNVRSKKKDTEIEGDLTLVREVTEVDKEKISALDWMVYYPHQRAESIWECNTLIRTFIAHGKLSAARLAFDRIPSDSLEMILQQFSENGVVNRDALPPKVGAAIKEYLSYKAYLDAQEGFSRWFHEFHNTRPNPPNKYEGNDFTEKLAYEHRLNRYNDDCNRWKSTMLHETKTIKALLFNILTFPDGGWLVDEYKEDPTRRDNMQRLRGLCIPQIFLLLHKVLHSMELYEEAIDLVSVLMDESTQFYKIFNRTQLNDITIKISESCDSILKTCLDPLGWEGGDPIDMVEDYDNEENDDLDRNVQSPAHINIDTTLEEIPGVGDESGAQEEEELITAWTKMAESSISKTYDIQRLKENSDNLEDSDDESL